MQIADWLKQQMDKRDINALSLSYALRISHVTIGKWLKGTYTPNPSNCRKIARYFGIPEQQVLIIAGHLQPNPSALAESKESYTAQPPGLGEAIHLFRNLTDDDQERILAIMRTFVNEQRRAQKPVPSGAPPG